ncbi:hypothetical protein ABTM90_19640, partial [Acinetobacter baumannii]
MPKQPDDSGKATEDKSPNEQGQAEGGEQKGRSSGQTKTQTKEESKGDQEIGDNGDLFMDELKDLLSAEK